MDDKGHEQDFVDDVDRVNAAASRGPLSALLGPAATVLGTRLGDWTERAFGKGRDNVRRHIEAVQAKNPQLEHIEIDATPGKQQDLFDWAQESKQYSEDDEDLSALWRGILDEILSNDDSQKRTISFAKELDRRDLALLCEPDIALAYHPREPRIERLVRMGLITIETNLKLEALRATFLYGCLAILAYLAFRIAGSYRLFGSFGEIANLNLLQDSLVVFSVITFILFFASLFFMSSRGWSLIQRTYLERTVVFSDSATQIVRAFRKYGPRGK